MNVAEMTEQLIDQIVTTKSNEELIARMDLFESTMKNNKYKKIKQ